MEPALECMYHLVISLDLIRDSRCQLFNRAHVPLEPRYLIVVFLDGVRLHEAFGLFIVILFVSGSIRLHD
jgi:hypothetical protein